jgi:hypothetical protein
MTHPCKSGDDTGASPISKMHACSAETSKMTLCGLHVDEESVNVLAGYASLCRTCFPPMREQASTAGNSNPGDLIGNRAPQSSPRRPRRPRQSSKGAATPA